MSSSSSSRSISNSISQVFVHEKHVDVCCLDTNIITNKETKVNTKTINFDKNTNTDIQVIIITVTITKIIQYTISCHLL